MSHPVRLSGRWPRPPDTCLTCLTRAMRVASSMWSLCGPGAGGWAWVHLGGRLGPSVGTDPGSQGRLSGGEWGGARLNRSLMEVWLHRPGGLNVDRVSLEVLA